MSELHKSLPVPGYQDQNSLKVGLVTKNKLIEEQVLRILDELSKLSAQSPGLIDSTWLADGRRQIESGFMAVNRAVFQPSRVSLPEDSND